METESLKFLLDSEDTNSEDILRDLWQRNGNIYSLLPQESFLSSRLTDLPKIDYAVMSTSWETPLQALAASVLIGDNPVRQKYIWIRLFCQDPKDYENDDDMNTMNRLCEIYHHAKAYYVMDIRSLLRAWCLFELSSVSVPPVLNNTNHDPAMSSLIWRNFYKYGFEGCQFRDGKEEYFLQKSIIDRYGSIELFNKKVLAIMDKAIINVSTPLGNYYSIIIRIVSLHFEYYFNSSDMVFLG